MTEQRGEQQDAAIAILDVGGMDDGVQQQTQRIDENMPLLALDQLAGIEPVRIDASPPCMGPFLSSGFRAATFLSCFLDRFLCSTWCPVSSSRPAVLQSRRAQELSSKVGRRPNLAEYCALARPHL